MPKSVTATTTRKVASKGNVGLYARYVEAWGRINRSIEQEFHFEAIAITESIMSNRLKSYLYGVGVLTASEANGKPYLSFRSLIDKLKAYSCDDGASLELADELDGWRGRRNSAIHAIAQSFPGQPPNKDLATFLDGAKATALDGKTLAKKVSNWHKKKLRAAKKAAKES